jgi:hypothetical protein
MRSKGGDERVKTIIASLVLSLALLVGAASPPSVAATTGASGSAPSGVTGICNPAWGSIVIPVCV